MAMLDPSDVELQRGDLPPLGGGGDGRSRIVVIAVAVLLILAGAAYWYFVARQVPEPESAPVAAAKPAPPPPAATQAALCAGGAPSTAVTSLDKSDPAVALLVRALSTSPRVAAWVATPNLIRSFVVAVDNIANGTMPRTQLRALRPAGPFRVNETRDAIRIDSRSYDRYNALADAVDSISPQAAAGLCASLKPRLEEAYKELGREGTFDQTLERAIVNLLKTPSIEPNTNLVPQGGVYGFEDEQLQTLMAAQKQLARMGPRNQRIIQEKLRQIALAIGVTADRLPAESIQ
jgi:hypothetical protein